MIPFKTLNPWWVGRESHILIKWRSMKYRWVPKWLEALSLDPFSLNFIIGPRQVGKTTGIHLLIEKLINGGIEPKSILYLDLDLIWDLNTFKRSLDDYLAMKRAEGYDKAFIILDEVTSLPQWWKLVKGYIDAGIFERDVLVLTGSSSLTLRGEAELFPGRTGKGKFVSALPLSFREFLDVMGIRVEITGDLDKDMARLLPMREEIRRLFDLYMKVGGFPLSINSDPSAGEALVKSLIGEIIRLNRKPSLAMSVLSSLFRKAPSPLSYSSIGKDVGISYKTARDYLDVLDGLMILGQAPFMEGSQIRWRKERKFFVRDPFLALAISRWTGVEPLPGALYEWVVQEHLYRRFGRIGYWRDGYEIDVVADGLKVEVKAGKPHRRYPRDVKVLDEDNMSEFLAVIV